MQSYSPSHLTPKESKHRINTTAELESIDVSDETLKQYALGVIDHYRALISASGKLRDFKKLFFAECTQFVLMVMTQMFLGFALPASSDPEGSLPDRN
jgi:transposase